MPSKTLSDEYTLIAGISSGTCGDVLKAHRKKTGEIVAVKRIKILNQAVGFPPNSLQEISILRSLNHPNIARLIEVCTESHHVYLVFSYYEYDMYGLLYNHNLNLTIDQVRCYSRQLLLGVKACHDKNILHRDLKPANLLVNRGNNLQITDFGLATTNTNCSTNGVITIWYRPPEILLGKQGYGKEIDIWSAGCIIYEMITHEVLFRSNLDQEADQLKAIFDIAGLPDQQWPEWKKLPNAELFARKIVSEGKILLESTVDDEQHREFVIDPEIVNRYSNRDLKNYIERRIKAKGEEYKAAIPLILSMLQINPKVRLTADKCLENDFLNPEKGVLDPSQLPPLCFNDTHQSIMIPQLPMKIPTTAIRRPMQPRLE